MRRGEFRKPGRDLLRPLPEREANYRGELVLYGSPELLPSDRDLYFGIAYAKDGADRAKGIALLEKAIAAAGAKAPLEAYIELAASYAAERNPRAGAANFRKALAIDPRLPTIRYNLGRALAELGVVPEEAARSLRATSSQVLASRATSVSSSVYWNGYVSASSS